MVSKILKLSVKAAFGFAFMFFCMSANGQKKTESTDIPDFAFPETVEKESAAALDRAVDSGNGVEAVKSLVRLIAARNLISPDSFATNVGIVDSVAHRIDQPYSLLCNLLQAKMYSEFYRASKYEYDGRVLPTDSFPEDPRGWNRDLFARKVYELVLPVVSKADDYEKTALQPFSEILTNVKEAEANGLTLFDFMMYNSAESLEAFVNSRNSSEAVIPFFGDAPGALAATSPFDCGALRRTIIEDVVKVREKDDDKLALAVAVLKSSDSLDYEKRFRWLSGWLPMFSGSEAAGRILVAAAQMINLTDKNGKECQDLYKEMREWLERFPGSQFSRSVRSQMERLVARSAFLFVEGSSLPGNPVEGKITVDNQKVSYVLVYKVPENSVVMNSFNSKILPSGMKLMEVIRVESDGEIPFRSEKSFETKALTAGHYLFIPSDVPRLPSDWKRKIKNWNSMVCVTDIAVFTVYNGRQNDSALIYVVDAATQAPIENASVSVYDDTGKKLMASGHTDASGSFKAPKGFNRVFAKKGGSTAWMYSDIQYNPRGETGIGETVSILTDLPIYRPGEKIGFAAVAWRQESHKNSLLLNREMSMILSDANGNSVDTLIVRTDESGRCSGSFTIPEKGLLGGWRIRATVKDSNKTLGSAFFQVAEYKTPTFIVDLKKDSDPTIGNADSIKFTGKIHTYSGMPLGDSDISFDVRWQPWWRYWNSETRPASYAGVAHADADGNFIIALPVGSLRKTDYEHGIFTVVVTATSPSGETQSSNPQRFVLGKGLEIRPDIDPKTEVTSDSLKFNVPVYDMLGNPVVTDVEYKVAEKESGKMVMEGAFESPQFKIPAATLSSGEYVFSFTLPSDTMKTEASTVIYRMNDRKVPCQSVVWTPDREVVCDGRPTTVIKAGSGFERGWILFTLSDEGGIISREWRFSNGDLLEFEVTSPEAENRLFASFTGMHDFSQMTETVTMIPETQMRKLDVEVISFRDRISAGDREKWQFRFTENGNPISGVAALAVMNNKALNAIVPNKWSFSPGRGFWSFNTYVSSIFKNSVNVYGNFSGDNRFITLPDCMPGWDTYGQQLAGIVRFRKFMATRSMMVKNEAKVGAVAGASDEIVVEEVQEAPLMMNAAVTADMSMGLAENAVERDGGSGSSDTASDIPLRPVDMPLAFFMPSLVSDADGVVTLSFETPDFNTTWQTQLMGYTPELLTASLIRDAVASKPVMVQTNVPRFVRTGDRATVSAMLFNNTSEGIMLEGDIEIFDSSTGRVIAKGHENASEVSPSRNKVVSVEFEVPSEISSLVVRAFARSGKSADGEQDSFPVLPSSTPVVESTTFYLGQGSMVKEVKLPKYNKDASIMLKYCSNPLWECVLALPSLTEPASKNLIASLNTLYADCMASGMIGKYPEISNGLMSMVAHSDSLESSLLKDQGYKTVDLGNTPWVNNAASETARMRSLSRFSDSKVVETTIDNIVCEILSLQNTDGGWSWCPDMRSSLFMTMKALSTFGELKRCGYLPASLSHSVLRGIDYCDRQYLEEARKAGSAFSYLGMADYLYIRSFFNGGDGPSGFQELKNKALSKIISSWREMSLTGKSRAAILLWRDGGRGGRNLSVCHSILESLAQFASKDPSKGWWFASRPSLETAASVLSAFAEINPKSEAVDGLRQWLVLQKETQDWGTDFETVAVIQAIVASGSDWTTTSMPEILMNGRPLEYQSPDSIVGMVAIPLTPKIASGAKLEITKDSDVPAWGGVISQMVLPIKDVKNQGCENMKVEKQLLLLNSDGEVMKTRKTNHFKVGDLVRVVLTVTCDKAMDYVALIDERAACLEPVEQLSGYEVVDGVAAYRETRDTNTSLFISSLEKGVHVFSYDCRIDRAGNYSTGIASVQSQYSPLQTAHSSGESILVE